MRFTVRKDGYLKVADRLNDGRFESVGLVIRPIENSASESFHLLCTEVLVFEGCFNDYEFFMKTLVLLPSMFGNATAVAEVEIWEKGCEEILSLARLKIDVVVIKEGIS